MDSNTNYRTIRYPRGKPIAFVRLRYLARQLIELRLATLLELSPSLRGDGDVPPLYLLVEGNWGSIRLNQFGGFGVRERDDVNQGSVGLRVHDHLREPLRTGDRHARHPMMSGEHNIRSLDM